MIRFLRLRAWRVHIYLVMLSQGWGHANAREFARRQRPSFGYNTFDPYWKTKEER